MKVSRLYHTLSRLRFLSFRGKIMLIAFIGTHVPLIALACYLALQSAPDWQTFFIVVGVTLIATLAGTAITLLVLHQLLQPIVLTASALRGYRETRRKSALPIRYTDEVGILMADADATIAHLEHARDTLEHIDEITNLPNRRKLIQLMARRAKLGLSFTVSVVRFANFARIVEAVDLAQASLAASTLANRIESEIRPGCVLARIDQSHFALFRGRRQDSEHEWAATSDLLHALIDRCSAVLPLDTLEIKPELLCGVAAFPQDADDIETLLDHAVAAAAQASSATPVVLYSIQARRAALSRLTVEQHLRRALDEDQFFLCYQPVVDIDSERVVSAEALIRWQKPGQGVVSPASFIPAAEASGLITPIGRWVMRQACEQLRQWKASGLDGMQISINLSARQFLDPQLRTHIAQAIDLTGIDAHQLELELTETSAMHDIDYTRRMLTRLRDLGVTVAFDDFGTGYASMTYLRNLPIDKLKIDREFVTDVHRRVDSQAICRSMITLSQGLGLAVVAEGTEKAEEVRHLRTEGCNLFQGFYFSKPLSARDFGEAQSTLPAHIAQNRPDDAKSGATLGFPAN